MAVDDMQLLFLRQLFRIARELSAFVVCEALR